MSTASTTNSTRQPLWRHPRALLYIAAATMLLVLFQPTADQAISTQFLPVGELISALLAALVGITGLTQYYIFNSRPLLFVSIGFIGASLGEACHAVISFTELSPYLPPYVFAVASWNSITSSIFLAAMLIAGRDASRGEITLMSESALSNRAVYLWSAFLAAVLFLLSFVFPTPQSFGARFILPQTLELIPGFMLLGVLFLFLLRGYWRYFSFQHWFVLSLIFITVNQLVYMPMSSVGTGTVPIMVIGLNLAAYGCAFVAMSSSTLFLFRNALEHRLRQSTEKLIHEKQITQDGSGESTFVAHSVPTNASWELIFDTGIFKANKVTGEILGTGSDMGNVGQFQTLIHPDDAAPVLEAFRRSKTKGDLFKQIFRFKHPLKGYIWIECIAGVKMVRGKAGSLLGFLVDVTTRQETEIEKDTLFSELEQVKATLDQHAAMAILDVDGRFMRVNDLLCESSGYSSEELIGQDIKLLYFDTHLPAAFDDLWETAKAGRSWQGDLSNRTKDGSLRWGATSIIPHVNRDGDIDSFFYLCTDITDRVIAEQALVESVQAHKKSNEDLQNFANIISHDMQEPLRMVSSFVTLLSRRYGDKLDDSAKEYINFAVDGAKRIQDLLEGLLEFSRVQTRGDEFSELDLTEPVEAAVSNLTMLIEETAAEITIGPLATIKGDKTQLMQLFQNLIANAIKFCDEPPPKIDIRAIQTEDGCSVAVTDKGIGIKPKDFERVFQIFQRLHGREEYEGTGVGLTVCRRIMERHNGSISVQSEPGEGSTFTLTFPD